MLQFIVPFITAICLSGIAGYYSVVGLAQIFPGSFWPVIIMGGTLEVAKLVTASWVYNNWKDTAKTLKVYFVCAIFVLMLITSMGIFGFLSRSHLETSVTVGANSVQLETLNAQEKIAKDRLTYLIKKAGDDPEKISKKTDQAIQEAQKELKTITDQKLPLLKEENKLMAEVGPIKYVAEFLYDKSESAFIDKAVRMVILMIIFVFDPLAVLLLIASNQSFSKRYKAKEKRHIDKKVEVSVQSNDIEIIPREDITNANAHWLHSKNPTD